MDFGLFYYCQGRGVGHDQAYAEMLDQIALADTLGFGECWFAEHHFTDYSLLPSPNLMLGLADGIGALRTGALEMTAKTEATLDLFVEQTIGPLLGAAIMVAFEIGREAGISPEALVLEMYMSGEMEAVFRGFREMGFFRASEDHGPTAVFGGMTRILELDREALARRLREVLGDITRGGFARRFQDEARNGYPMLEMARAMMHGPSPISDAEKRLRRLTGPDRA